MPPCEESEASGGAGVCLLSSPPSDGAVLPSSSPFLPPGPHGLPHSVLVFSM